MKIIIHILFCLISIFCPVIVFGQQETENANTLSEEFIFLQQILNNQISIDQTDQYLNANLYIGNNAFIFQSGNGNDAQINQYGDYNFSLINQIGHFNEAELDLRGDRNYATIEQYGSYNVAEKAITGNDNWFFLEQIGNNLQFSVEGRLPPGTIITQEGNGMQIEIK